MKNLRIAVKISIAVGILLVGLLSIGVLSIYNLGIVNDQSTEITVNWLPSVDIVNRLNTNTSDLRIAQGTHIMSTTEEEMGKAEKDINQTNQTIAENRKIYEALISSEEERQIYNTFGEQWGSYLALSDKVLELSRKNANEEASALFKGEARQHYDEASATLLQLVDLNRKGASDASATGDTIYAQSRTIIVSTLIVIMVVSVGVSILLVRSISRPATAIASVLQTMSTGNLDITVPETDRGDEMGDIAKASLVFQEGMIKARKLDQEAKQEAERQAERGRQMEQAVSAFETVITEVVAVVSSAATELQATAQTLSATAEETAQQSTAVAAATEEMSQNVQTVASATEELSASISEI
uniref:MCP four helix bundle domain-containing protein n=1 Tax=Dongia sp. TaxID=1977262 RepID=UPI0035B4DB3C